MGTTGALIIHDRAAWIAAQDDLARLSQRDSARHRARGAEHGRRRWGPLLRLRHTIAAVTS
jgi:hypothetical protein